LTLQESKSKSKKKKKKKKNMGVFFSRLVTKEKENRQNNFPKPEQEYTCIQSEERDIKQSRTILSSSKI